MSSEISASLFQLRALHEELLAAFDKLYSLLDKLQEAQDIISYIPDAHSMLSKVTPK
jgi:hypothetical protein